MIYVLLLLAINVACCTMQGGAVSFLDRRSKWLEGTLELYERAKRSAQKEKGAECEHKQRDHDVAFERLHEKYKLAIRTKLELATPLPTVLCSLIIAYITLGLTHKKYKLFDKNILHLSFQSNARICVHSTGDDQASLIDEETGEIVQRVSTKGICSREVPATFRIYGSQDNLYDFDESCDQLSKVTIHLQGQVVLVHKGMTLEEAILRQKYSITQPHKDYERFLTVRFSPDGQYVIVGGTDGIVRIFDATTVETVFFLNHKAPVTALAIHEEGTALLVGLGDGSIYCWKGLFLNHMHELVPIKQAISVDPSPGSMHMTDGTDDSPFVRLSPGSFCKRNLGDCFVDFGRCCDDLQNGCNFNRSCASSALSCTVRCPCCCVYSLLMGCFFLCARVGKTCDIQCD